jgi:hypothetical protein
MATYVVATRREAKSDGLSAEECVRDIPGVEVKGSGNAHRLVIEMSPETADQLQQRFGERLLVEPIIKYNKF